MVSTPSGALRPISWCSIWRCPGIELLARLREERPLIPTIVFSALGSILNPEFVKSLRVAAVIPKPAHVHQLVEAVTKVLGADAHCVLSLSESCAPLPGTS